MFLNIFGRTPKEINQMKLGRRREPNTDYAHIAWSSVYPISGHEEIYQFTIDDIIIIAVSIFTTLAVWFSFRYYSLFAYMFRFWDASEIYASYKLSSNMTLRYNDPYQKIYKVHYQYFLNPLPLPRNVFRIFYYLSFGKAKIAQFLFTLTFSTLSALIFRRLLIVYEINKSPLFSSIIFCMFPVRHLLFKSLPTYDEFFFTLILLSFLFYRMDYQIPLLITILAACLTRFEGIILFLVFFTCNVIAVDFKGILFYGAPCFLTFLFYTIQYPNFTNFIIPNWHDSKDSFKFSCYHHFFELRKAISNLRVIHSSEMVWFPGIFGALLLLYQSLPLSLFCFFYSIFLSFIKSKDLHRFAIPIHVISILIGFDFCLSQPMMKFVISCLIPVFFLGELYYCGYQIRSHLCPDELIYYLYN